jgi:uncharacterized protein
MSSSCKYEIFQGDNKQWYWRLKSPNGRIVGCGEGYVRRSGAMRGVQAHRRGAATARVVMIK